MKKLRVFFLSTALSDEIYNTIVADCKRFKPTFSGVGFDRNVALGLSQLTQVQGVSLYPLPSYPKYQSIWKSAESYTLDNFHCTVPAMLSLPIIKEYVYYYQAVRYIKKQLQADESAVIVTCGLYRSLLRPARKLKKKFGLPVCAIVPDLPELMITYRKDYSKIRKWLNRQDVKRSWKYRTCADAFVFLSKYMDSQVNIQGKPSLIVDGLCRIPDIQSSEDKTEPYILYAGKITKQFGVDKLVEGFQATNIPQLRLYLCGDGDYAQTLRQIAQQDDRIQYLGMVPHERVLSLETTAELLVDPRPVDNEVAKMAFPSKIIEYMASGTPVLTTNLPCFSEEYARYQYRIQEVSAEGIKKALEEVFKLPAQDRAMQGETARQFVLENKTLEKQCEKIFSLLKEVVETI